jgi:2-(1,2-epoxy-1,2-dihydrophenyl)acetyl-CoA isomerase
MVQTGVDEGLQIDTRGPVRWLTLTRPSRRNALMVEDRLALAEALSKADHDPDVRVVAITGYGDYFCAGGDVREFQAERTRAEAEEYAVTKAQAVFRVMRSMRTPTVARVRGVAAGAGMYLALGSDIVVAEEGGFFHPGHLDLAVTPDWGAIWLMPRLIGTARAKAAMLTGNRIAFDTAARWGLIAECVPTDQLDSVVNHYCERIACIPEAPMALTRRGLDASLDRSLDAFLDWEAMVIADMMTRPEHRERVDAFLEPRNRQAT